MPTAEQDSNKIIERLLDDRITTIEAATGGDVLTYLGPIMWGIEDQIKFRVEEITNRKKKLSVVLETTGGYMEVAERIANVFRHHYGVVEFLVPSFAMSAGTVLVMSGDAIHMDYSSVLGPIDPQVQRPGRDIFIPALGYLEQYQRLIEKSRAGELTTAELMYLVQNFNPAELYRYEQERELSIACLRLGLSSTSSKIGGGQERKTSPSPSRCALIGRRKLPSHSTRPTAGTLIVAAYRWRSYAAT